MKPRSERTTTLRQIAEVAGVSVTTVAKVLHDVGGNVRVGAATESKVRDAAEKLNYVPNGLARSMRTGKTETIGLVFEQFGRIGAGPLFYPQLLDGVCSALFPLGFRLSVVPSVDLSRPAASLADGRIDGVIWAKMPDDPAVADALISAGLPCVALGNRPESARGVIPLVGCDNLGGSRLVADHLQRLGHRKAAFVLEAGEVLNPDARQRLEGFQKAWQGELEVQTWSSDAREILTWIREPGRATALYAWNENLGAAILREAMDETIAVPGEISVVGFDSTQFCETTQPRLTAVNQPIFEMAYAATRALLDQCQGIPMSRPDQTFSCTLDVRDSTAPPAA
ncbi:MAG: LacI family DNA-binding transcriptional regulator [Fimbriimonadaceae bacterium]